MTLCIKHIGIITARKRSLRQGTMFTPVCHSVHRGEVPGPGGVSGPGGGGLVRAFIHISKQGVKDIPQ